MPSTNAEDPAWSPDCSQIVYTENGSLWLVGNDGTGREKLVDRGTDYLTSAAWSSDGSKIVYAHGYQDGDLRVWHIWTVNSDGTDPTKLTHGNANRDRWPRWSPDGTKIVFDRSEDGDRFIATMNDAGKQEKALTAGGSFELAPVWSPDGTQLAYISDGTVYVADLDGSNPVAAIHGVYGRGELAWSPSGNRIAFARGDHTGSDIFIAEADGSSQEQVTDLDGQALAPRWSADGQLLAFHTITSDGKHRAFVTGASGEPVRRAADCRPERNQAFTTGFPRSREHLPTTGTLRIGVLFVDFADATAEHSAEDEIARNFPFLEEYFEASSYGQLDVELVPHKAWLRSSARVGEASEHGHAPLSVLNEAVELAGDDVDFSKLDTVLVVLPSTKFWLAATTPVAGFEGSTPPLTFVNSSFQSAPGGLNEWARFAVSHYLSRGRFALPQLWPGDWRRHQVPEAPEGMRWVRTTWGMRGLNASFLASKTDSRFDGTWTFANGIQSRVSATRLKPEEMLAWTRWKLDWLGADQVACLTPREATVELAPIADPGDGIAMAAIPINEHEVIVMESRRKIGYDRTLERAEHDGTHSTLPHLAEEGVLIYTVDAWINEGGLPIKVAGDTGNGQVADFPVLAVGESITVRGYEITVTADDGDTHTVQITKLVGIRGA